MKNQGSDCPDPTEVTVTISDKQVKEWAPEIFAWAETKRLKPVELIAFLGILRNFMMQKLGATPTSFQRMDLPES